MCNYQKNKAEARQMAMDWQLWMSENSVSYEGVAIACEYFEKLAKRYGLVREFRENGII